MGTNKKIRRLSLYPKVARQVPLETDHVCDLEQRVTLSAKIS